MSFNHQSEDEEECPVQSLAPNESAIFQELMVPRVLAMNTGPPKRTAETRGGPSFQSFSKVEQGQVNSGNKPFSQKVEEEQVARESVSTTFVGTSTSSEKFQSQQEMVRGAKAELEKREAIRVLGDRLRSPGDCAPLADFSKLARRVLDSNPFYFLVQSPKTWEEVVTLRHRLPPADQADSISVAGPQIRSVVESDLAWMDAVGSVAARHQQHFNLCAPLYFVPPRCVLITSMQGNEQCERASEVHVLLEEYFATNSWVPLTEFSPGVACVMRNPEEEYVRCVVLDQRSDGSGGLLCCCLDFHSLVECEPADLAPLPPFASVENLLPSTFLARLRGIDHVPLVHQHALQAYCGVYAPGSPMASMYPTAIFGLDGTNRCVVDWVVPGVDTWVSQVLTDRGIVVPNETDPEPPSSLEAIECVDELQQQGFFAHKEEGLCDTTQNSMVPPTCEDQAAAGDADLAAIQQEPEKNLRSENTAAAPATPCSEVEGDVDCPARESVPAPSAGNSAAQNFYQSISSVMPFVSTSDSAAILHSSLVVALMCENACPEPDNWSHCVALLERKLAECRTSF